MKNCLLTIIILLSAAAAFADEIVLRDGRKINGVVETEKDEYVIRSGASAMRIPKHEVSAIIRKQTLEQRYENLRLVTPENDVKEQIALGKWCRANNLPKQAQAHFKRALELEPNNYEARRGAGFQLVNGEWKTREEIYREQGKELYKGEWLPRETVEKKVAAAALEAEKKQAREQVREVVRRAVRLDANDSGQPLIRQLAELTAPNTDALLGQNAYDSSPQVRGVVYGAIAARANDEGLAVLNRRFRQETHPALVKRLGEILAAWQPAPTAKLLETAMQAGSKKVRRRAWPVLRRIADKEIVDTLVAGVDFCPVPETEQKRPNKAETDGVVSSADAPPRKPYYPAHQLLVYLTHQNFRHDQKKEWQEWWQKNRETFDFAHPPQAAEAPKNDAGLPRGSGKKPQRKDRK